MNLTCAHSRVCLLETTNSKDGWRTEPWKKLRRNVSLEPALSLISTRRKFTGAFSIFTVFTISCNQVISPLTAPATPTLKELSNALDAVVDWHSLGVKLGLEDHELSAIDKNFRGDIARCKHETLILLLAKWQASHMERNRWCSSADGRRHSCLRDTSKTLQLFDCDWYVSTCLRAKNLNLSALGSYNIMKQQHNLVVVHI